MIKSSVNKFNKIMYLLYPGEHFVTSEDCILGTVTGYCVAVCVFDSEKGIGGMGHFVVPGSVGTQGIIADDISRIGIVNMEYLIGEIVKLGGDRKYLRAKIFGASYLYDSEQKLNDLSENNIKFLNEYFTLEGIHLERADLGGNFRRKIYFSVKNGKVYRQKLKNNEESSEFMVLEKEYIDREFDSRERAGKVVLFE